MQFLSYVRCCFQMRIIHMSQLINDNIAYVTTLTHAFFSLENNTLCTYKKLYLSFVLYIIQVCMQGLISLTQIDLLRGRVGRLKR